MKKNEVYDNDGKLVKLEYTIYKKLFKMVSNKYDDNILIILRKIIEDHPEYTLYDIKKHIYENNKIHSYKLLDNIYEKSITLKDRYDALFGKPIKDNFYKKNYLNIIKEILNDFPNINNEDLSLEFEFRQPIWAELLLKNQTINALLYKDSRFRTDIPVNIPDKNFIKNNVNIVINGNDEFYSLNKKAFDDGNGRKTLIKNSYIDNTTYKIFKTNEEIRKNYI